MWSCWPNATKNPQQPTNEWIQIAGIRHWILKWHFCRLSWQAKHFNFTAVPRTSNENGIKAGRMLLSLVKKELPAIETPLQNTAIWHLAWAVSMVIARDSSWVIDTHSQLAATNKARPVFTLNNHSPMRGELWTTLNHDDTKCVAKVDTKSRSSRLSTLGHFCYSCCRVEASC